MLTGEVNNFFSGNKNVPVEFTKKKKTFKKFAIGAIYKCPTRSLTTSKFDFYVSKNSEIHPKNVTLKIMLSYNKLQNLKNNTVKKVVKMLFMNHVRLYKKKNFQNM